uniref:Uncharacterized protein n=1 Tax=Astyanax mexicanus TaxID=7994 RepID=A0A8B9GZG5_ASTMX
MIFGFFTLSGTYRDLTPLVLLYGDGDAVHLHLHLSYVRVGGAPAVIVTLRHREGLQAVQGPAGLRQRVRAGALEVVVKAVEGEVMRVTPRPAGGAVGWDTTAHVLTRVWR